MNSEALNYIEQSQQRWRPCDQGDVGWDPRLQPVPVGDVYWTDCQKPDTPYIPSWNPRFMPSYSPMAMMGMGVFGDSYWFGPIGEHRMAMLPQNYPFARFEVTKHKPSVNHFGRKSGLSKDWWLDRGLIFNADPLGFFEWFCWYWMGRRIDEYDDHQIQRWAGYRIRQRAMYAKTGHAGTAQALLHWGIAI